MIGEKTTTKQIKLKTRAMRLQEGIGDVEPDRDASFEPGPKCDVLTGLTSFERWSGRRTRPVVPRRVGPETEFERLVGIGCGSTADAPRPIFDRETTARVPKNKRFVNLFWSPAMAKKL